MPEMKSVGRIFFGHLRLRKGTPFLHRAMSTEIDHPFRSGPGTIIRIWPGHGIIIGTWTEQLDEDAAMRRGLGAREERLFDEHGTLLAHYGRASDDEFWCRLEREARRSHLQDPEICEERDRSGADDGDAWSDRPDDW